MRAEETTGKAKVRIRASSRREAPDDRAPLLEHPLARFGLRITPLAFGIAISVYLTVDALVQRIGVNRFLEDFDPSYWAPWHALRSGVNPYPNPIDQFAAGPPFLYPPLSPELTLPLSWLPHPIAGAIFVAALVTSAALTLWALDVRSPALAVLWMSSAVVTGAALGGQATLFVILGVALVWRWRDRATLAAFALTAAICIKLFAWPILVWLLITRRYRASLYTAVASVSLIVASWAVIGFQGFTGYPALMDGATQAFGKMGFLAFALTVKYASDSIAVTATLLIAGLLLIAALVCRDNDRAAFTLTVLATLYATPIVWLHYLGLLVIPAALYGGWLWAAIPLLWLVRLAAVGHPRPSWLIACFIAVTVAFVFRVFSDVRARPAERLEMGLGAREVSAPATQTQI